MLPIDSAQAKLAERVRCEDFAGPAELLLRARNEIDVTALLNADVAADFDTLKGEDLGPVKNIVHAPCEMRPHAGASCLLAPCDLQALKACGVTFARSMIERVIDERTQGDAVKADALRQRIGELIGGSLANVKAGSKEAQTVETALIAEGPWSQYLEVRIGPGAEVFTKSQPMSSVGHGAEVGINPISDWNNPEPEIVMAVDSEGNIRGATLGNDDNPCALRGAPLTCQVA